MLHNKLVTINRRKTGAKIINENLIFESNKVDQKHPSIEPEPLTRKFRSKNDVRFFDGKNIFLCTNCLMAHLVTRQYQSQPKMCIIPQHWHFRANRISTLHHLHCEMFIQRHKIFAFDHSSKIYTCKMAGWKRSRQSFSQWLDVYDDELNLTQQHVTHRLTHIQTHTLIYILEETHGQTDRAFALALTHAQTKWTEWWCCRW